MSFLDNPSVLEDDEDAYMDEKNDQDSGIMVRMDSVSSDTNDEVDPATLLPVDWKTYDFQRKKSCILSNIYSTCVSKAINHLEILQNAIDKWMQKNPHASYTSLRATQNLGVKTAFEMIRNRAITTAPTKNSELALSRELSIKTGAKVDSLEVFGVGVNAKIPAIEYNVKEKSLIVTKRDEPYTDLKASDVINEVLLLLARLEQDRRRTESHLEEEKKSVASLRKKIDKLGLQRLHSLPIIVQREHEACITDITELEWHIAYHSQNLKKLEHKTDIEEKFYNQLNEEIENMNKRTPLIEEKCSLELKAIQKILNTQEETNALLALAREKNSEVADRNKDAHVKADKEMEAIKSELDYCRRELNKAKKRLEEAEETWAGYLQTLEESNIKIAKNKVEEREQTIRRDQNREKKIDLSKYNSQLQNDRFRAKKETDILTIDNEALRRRVEEENKHFNEEIVQLTNILNEKRIKSEKIQKKILEKQVNIDVMQVDKVSILNNIDRENANKEKLLSERIRSENQLKTLRENFTRAEKLHETVSSNLEKDTERYSQLQESMRLQINETKKQIKEERHYYASLSARLNTEIDEFKLAVVDSRVRKQQFETKKKELDTRLAKLEETVSEMEEKKKVLDEKVDKLQNSVNSIKENHAKLEKELTDKIKHMKPLKVEETVLLDKRKREMVEMKKHTEEMSVKNSETDESMSIMTKSMERMDAEISKIMLIVDEYNIQYQAAKNLDLQAKNTLKEIVDRNHENEQNHLHFLRERQAYYNDLQEKLQNELDRNKNLASKYRETKYELYLEKIKLLLKYEKGLDVFSKVSDKRQVHTLQSRMHIVLQDYFNYKIQFGQKAYSKLTNETASNYDKLIKLETFFQSSLKQITEFLNNQEDFDLVHQKIMQKVFKEELIDRQKKIEETKAYEKLAKDQLLENDKQYKAKVRFNLENMVN